MTDIREMKFAAAFSDGESECVLSAKSIADLERFFWRLSHGRLKLNLSRVVMLENTEIKPLEMPKE